MKNRKGFTLLQTIVVVSIMMILAAVALPTLGVLSGKVQDSLAKQVVDVGNTALRLDFAKQIMEGKYASPFPQANPVGQRLRSRNTRILESLLESGFSYPPGFQWILVEQATSTQPPVVGYRSK